MIPDHIEQSVIENSEYVAALERVKDAAKVALTVLGHFTAKNAMQNLRDAVTEAELLR